MRQVIKKILLSIFFLCRPLFLLIFPRVTFNDADKKYQWQIYSWCIRSFWQRNILRLAPPTPFPCALTCVVSDAENIEFNSSDLENFQSPGTYYQCFAGKITIGKGTVIAPNVGIITCNHNTQNPLAHDPAEDVKIGDNCWIGMNAIILPGVILADNTIVGAGTVVTKSSLNKGEIIIGCAGKPLRSRK